VDWDAELPNMPRSGRGPRVPRTAATLRLDAGLEASRQSWEQSEAAKRLQRQQEGAPRHQFAMLPGLTIAGVNALCADCDETMAHPIHETAMPAYEDDSTIDDSDLGTVDYRRRAHYGSTENQEATDETSYAKVMATWARWNDPKTGRARRSYDRRLYWSGVNFARQERQKEKERDYKLYLPKWSHKTGIEAPAPVRAAFELDLTGAIVRFAPVRETHWNGPMDSDPREYTYSEVEWSVLQADIEVTDWQPDWQPQFQTPRAEVA